MEAFTFGRVEVQSPVSKLALETINVYFESSSTEEGAKFMTIGAMSCPLSLSLSQWSTTL